MVSLTEMSSQLSNVSISIGGSSDEVIYSVSLRLQGFREKVFIFKSGPKSYARFDGVVQHLPSLHMHFIKPDHVGIQHAKGFWDWSTYRADTRHLKIHTNFWTHCMLSFVV